MLKILRFAIALLCILDIQFIASGQTRSITYYLDIGLSNSPVLKDYGNQILSSRLDSLKLKASTLPQINAISGVGYSPTIHGYGYDETITNGGNYNAQLTASQNIFNRGILKPQYESIKIIGQLLENKKKISGIELRHSISEQYLLAYADIKQMENTQTIYLLLIEEESILKSLVNHGIVKQTAYFTFDLEMHTQNIFLSQLKNQYRIDIASLNMLCGINDTTLVNLSEPDFVPSNSSLSFRNSIFYMQFYMDSLKIKNERSLVDIRYKPHFALNADGGTLSSTPANLYRHSGVSAAIGLQIPIFDGNQRKYDYQKLALQEQSRSNYAVYFHSQYNLQINQLNIRYKGVMDIILQLKEQLKRSESLMDIGRKELNRGDISVTDFLLMVKGNIEIRNNLNQNQIKIWQIINDINYWNR